MGLRVAGSQCDRPAILGDSFVVPALLCQRGAEVGMSGGVVRTESEGLANPRHSEVNAPGLMRDHAEVVQRFRMVGLHGKDLPVERFSVRQSAGLVVLEGLGEHLWDCNRGHGGHSV